MVFYNDKGILYPIDEDQVIYYSEDELVFADDLPDAFYPLYKLDENGNIVPDAERILEKAKIIQIENIESAFEEEINSGYVCSNGIKMHTTFDDIQKLKAGLELMQKLNQTESYIADYDDVLHQVSIDELDNMLIELGVNYLNLWRKKGELITQIKQVNTLDEVLAIEWNENA